MNEIENAIKRLKAGSVVAIPTETVYGLAASIESPEGINSIFSTKERPFFDPLIVHCARIEQVRTYCSGWTTVHQKLAENFWPGPMTLILNKTSTIDEKITSGLNTVGMRIPNHPKTLELINKLGHPIAAPSANKFKKISPTKAEDVRSEFPDVLVIDGGPCAVGIESTILRVENDKIIIYRPGMINKNQIEHLFENKILVEQNESPIAPGHLKHHYMPNKKLYFLLNTDVSPTDSAEWKLPLEATIAARELYSKLREMDNTPYKNLVVTITENQLKLLDFRGVINRLSKACYFKSDLINPEY